MRQVISVRPGNAALGIPTLPSVILLLDEMTGVPTALVDGTTVTVMRTAAGSAVATRAMAPAAAASLVVFGAGRQAVEHVSMMLAVRPSIRTVCIINRSVDTARSVVTELTASSADAGVAFTVVALGDDSGKAAAVRGADIICTCTNASEPLFDGRDVKPGAHINAIGAFTPTMHELDAVTASRAVIVTDTEKAETAGDLATPLASGVITKPTHVRGNLGELLCGAIGLKPMTAGQVRAPETPYRALHSLRGCDCVRCPSTPPFHLGTGHYVVQVSRRCFSGHRDSQSCVGRCGGCPPWISSGHGHR